MPQKNNPNRRVKVENHPRFKQLRADMVSGKKTWAQLIAEYYADEVEAGAKPASIKMRLIRYKRSNLLPNIERAVKRAEKAQDVDVLGMLTDLHKGTLELRDHAASKNEWSSVNHLTDSARSELELYADATGQRVQDQAQQPNVAFQQIIALPRTAPAVAAPDYDGPQSATMERTPVAGKSSSPPGRVIAVAPHPPQLDAAND